MQSFKRIIIHAIYARPLCRQMDRKGFLIFQKAFFVLAMREFFIPERQLLFTGGARRVFIKEGCAGKRVLLRQNMIIKYLFFMYFLLYWLIFYGIMNKNRNL